MAERHFELPDGSIRTIYKVDVQPSPDWVLLPDGLPASAPTNDQINAERDRRIEAGAEFALADGTVISMTGRQPDKDVLLARRIVAAEMLAAGVIDPILVFRDRDNVNHDLTPAQMIELVDLGLAWFEAMMVRSWHMKDGTGDYPGGIPADFDQDIHWPAP